MSAIKQESAMRVAIMPLNTTSAERKHPEFAIDDDEILEVAPPAKKPRVVIDLTND